MALALASSTCPDRPRPRQGSRPAEVLDLALERIHGLEHGVSLASETDFGEAQEDQAKVGHVFSPMVFSMGLKGKPETLSELSPAGSEDAAR